MQNWARRGLQTALVTGGLLMLGTGIASADENVNPDRPASPLDPSVKIPVRVHDNAAGTPLGRVDLPKLKRDVTVNPEAATKGLPAVGRVSPAVGNAVIPAVENLPYTPHLTRVTQNGEVFRGNHVSGDLVVPVEATGNAVAAGGDVDVNSVSDEDFAHSSPVVTYGSQETLAGNVANLDWTAPVRVSGNAVGALDRATTSTTSSHSTTAGGDLATDGTEAVLAGNVVSSQLATPAQVTGNSVSGVGIAESSTSVQDSAYTTGVVKTGGNGGVGSGNGNGVPVALPVVVHGNSFSGAGKAESTAVNGLTTDAGAPQRDPAPFYIESSGREGVLSGAVVQPAVAGPAGMSCNSGTAIGTAHCAQTVNDSTEAGGATKTTGDASTVSGTHASVPVALPVKSFGNATSGAGLAEATTAEKNSATAGGDAHTHSDGAVLAGTTAHTPLATPVELLGNGTSLVGAGTTDVSNDVTSKAGGYTATTGNESTLSGNAVAHSVALPLETLGNSSTVAGKADGSTDETKVTTAGGATNTDDDAGVLSSNAAVSSLAGPAQLFGNSTAPGGIANSATNQQNTSLAGGGVRSKGAGGSASGNVANVPLTLPAQAFGMATGGVGKAGSATTGNTTSTSGGDTATDGRDGALAGNIAALPGGTATQAFGLSTGAGGITSTATGNSTKSSAGGDVTTSGAGGAVSGNVAGAQPLSAAQTAGLATSAASLVGAYAPNDTQVSSGGDVTTNGDRGSISGTLVDVPVAAAGQAFGDATSVGGKANGVAPNKAKGHAGGQAQTSGVDGSLSGTLLDVPVPAAAQMFGNATSVGGSAFDVAPNDSTVHAGGAGGTKGLGRQLSGLHKSAPAGGIVQVFAIPTPVMADAMTYAPNVTTASADETAPLVNLPITPAGLPVTALPSLPGTPTQALPVGPTPASRADLPVTPVGSGAIDVFGVREGLPLLSPELLGNDVTEAVVDLPLGAEAMLPQLLGGDVPTEVIPAVDLLDTAPFIAPNPH